MVMSPLSVAMDDWKEGTLCNRQEQGQAPTPLALLLGRTVTSHSELMAVTPLPCDGTSVVSMELLSASLPQFPHHLL